MSNDQNKYVGAFVAVTTLFFLWGFITVFVDSLIPRLREVFELSYFQSGLVQFAYFIAYGVVSIPASFLLPRLGYKKGLVLGLFTMGVGCMLLWPAAGLREYGIFLAGLFVLAGGMTVLQVAANPYISVLGPERKASSRLNLAQAFNSLGTTIAPFLGALLILSDDIKTGVEIEQLGNSARLEYYAQEAAAVQTPFLFLAISIIVIAIALAFIKLPVVLSTQSKQNYSHVLGDKRLMLGAAAIFLYVGSEVTIGSYMVNYFMDMGLAKSIQQNGFMRDLVGFFFNRLENVDAKGIVGFFVGFYWGGAMVGRFLGAYLTTIISPSRVLYIFGGMAVIMLGVSALTQGFVSMWSIIAVGLFNSVMFPTIFTLAIEKLDHNKPQGSGILCTAIVGGAAIPPIFGALADISGFKVALLLLIICYGFIFFYGTYTYRPSTELA